MMGRRVNGQQPTSNGNREERGTWKAPLRHCSGEQFVVVVVAARAATTDEPMIEQQGTNTYMMVPFFSPTRRRGGYGATPQEQHLHSGYSARKVLGQVRTSCSHSSHHIASRNRWSARRTRHTEVSTGFSLRAVN